VEELSLRSFSIGCFSERPRLRMSAQRSPTWRFVRACSDRERVGFDLAMLDLSHVQGADTGAEVFARTV
jgi:hypothetical protein